MVKIINGEIVADDDPRLRQRQQPPPPAAGRAGYGHGAPEAVPLRPRPPAAGGGGGGTGLDVNKPPFKIVPPAPGSQPLMGLPDMEIFGVRVTPYALLAAAALGAMMGWRGVMVALILYYVYLASQSRAGGPGQGQHAGAQARPGGLAQQQQGPGMNPMDFLQGYLNGPQPRRSGAAAGASGGYAGAGRDGQAGPYGGGADGDASASGRGEAGGSGGGGWAAFQGKGNKLGGK